MTLNLRDSTPGLRWWIFLVIFATFLDYTAATICPSCNRNFGSLGRHYWRCNGRMTSQAYPTNSGNTINSPEAPVHLTGATLNHMTLQPVINNNSDALQCTCGKMCKGKRGLRAHQRSCHAHQTLSNAFSNDDDGDDDVGQQNLELDGRTDDSNDPPWTTSNDMNAAPKPGLILPKSQEKWLDANAYFHSVFDMSNTEINNLDEFVATAQQIVYDYFATTFGTTKDGEPGELEAKYSGNAPIKTLKKTLKQLKHSHADVDEIRYVSRLIRKRLAQPDSDHDIGDLENQFKMVFWQTCKNIFNRATKSVPTFDIAICEAYFQKVLSNLNLGNRFAIPSWIPKLQLPTMPCQDNPPLYREVANAVNKCKSKASACPLDQLSIIILKRCPILRSLLHIIIAECWRQRYIPMCWKRAATILIYKKGETSDPANFRPITLHLVGTGQNGSGQNGTDKMVADKMVRTKWYGQNGRSIRTKWYWTKWYGQNGMVKMVWTKWYGQNG